MHWDQLNFDEEHARILKEYEHKDFDALMGALERQFTVIHNRAHLLLTLCGIVVTLTGFSGRIIAGTNVYAQIFIILGLSITMLGAGVMVWFVLHLHWLTAQTGSDRSAWLVRCLQYRNRKTYAYRVSIRLLMLGMFFYCTAVAIMLVNPLNNVVK